MRHGVGLVFAEGDPLHLAEGGVAFDAVVVAFVAVAWVQDQGMTIGDAGGFVQTASGSWSRR